MAGNPAPAGKAGELLDRLIGIAARRDVDDLALERVAQEAQALMPSHAAGAHTVLGAVASVRGDIEGVRRHHGIALRLEDTPTMRYNYSVSLAHTDENQAAMDLAREALESSADDLKLIHHAIEAALESANFAAMLELCEQWDAVSPKEPSPHAAAARKLRQATTAGEFTEDAVREVLDTVTAVRRDEAVRKAGFVLRCPDDVDDSFYYERLVYATPTLAAEVNERLADRISQRTELFQDPGSRFVAAFRGAG